MYRRLLPTAVLVVSAITLAGCNSTDGGNTPKSDTASSSVSTPGAHTTYNKPTPSTSTANKGVSKPLTDGVYRAEHLDGTGSRSFMRFFDDGTVCEVGTTASSSSDNVRRWLKPGGSVLNTCTDPGAYAAGFFTLTTARGSVDFTITRLSATGETFDSSSVSHINGHKQKGVHMVFSPDNN